MTDVKSRYGMHEFTRAIYRDGKYMRDWDVLQELRKLEAQVQEKQTKLERLFFAVMAVDDCEQGSEEQGEKWEELMELLNTPSDKLVSTDSEESRLRRELNERTAFGEGLKRHWMELVKQRNALSLHLKEATELLDLSLNGLKWYRDAYPEADSQADDEMYSQIEEFQAKAFEVPEQHPDDKAIDLWAESLKSKMKAARDKGRNGWDDPELCPDHFLVSLFVDHMLKGNDGNLLDIGVIAMMLHTRGIHPSKVQEAVQHNTRVVRLYGASSFKKELLAATNAAVHPHIEGVFAAWQEKEHGSEEESPEDT